MEKYAQRGAKIMGGDIFARAQSRIFIPPGDIISTPL